jgi:hypothetical protein
MTGVGAPRSVRGQVEWSGLLSATGDGPGIVSPRVDCRGLVLRTTPIIRTGVTLNVTRVNVLASWPMSANVTLGSRTSPWQLRHGGGLIAVARFVELGFSTQRARMTTDGIPCVVYGTLLPYNDRRAADMGS